MAPRKVTIPLGMGVNQTPDPKLAPFGLLKDSKNIRIKQRGNLGVRNGYAALDMGVPPTGILQMHAYDLFSYKNRLCALGNTGSDGHPTNVYEYVDEPSFGWKTQTNNGLNPFTNLRDIAGIPQSAEEIQHLDSAIGAGYTCLVYELGSGNLVYAVILDQATDQVVLVSNIFSTTSAPVKSIKVLFANNTFFIIAQRNDNRITVLKFNPLTDTAISAHIATVSSSGTSILGWDAAVVTNPTTAQLIFVYNREDTDDTDIKIYDSTGAQVGSTITVNLVDTIWHAIEADQTNNTIVLLTISSPDTATLRTFNFTTGALTVGPTTIHSGVNGSICRLFPQTGFASVSVAVMLNNLDGDTAEWGIYTVAAHTGSTNAIGGYQLRSKLLNAQTANEATAIIHSGVVAPDITTLDQATNCLFYSTTAVTFCSKRDFLKAKDPATQTTMVNLSRDTSTGKLCWVALMDPGIDDISVPSVALADLFSTKRRQGVEFGSHYYLSGATPSIYDGRALSDLGFNEAPGILEATPSSASGNLTGGATYYYTVHWEYVHADKSVMYSPVSVGGNNGEAFTTAQSVTLAPGDTRVTLTCSSPHHLLVSLGNNLYGANIIAVLSRTEWDPSLNAPKSILRRAQVKAVPKFNFQYGDTLQFVDQISDVDLASRAAIYTQAEKGVLSGPLEQNAPQPCSYITADESRLLLGGLLRSSDIQISREAFRGEVMGFSEFSNFFNQIIGSVEAVQNLDGTKLVFTEKDAFALTGDGPDDLGGGVLTPPIEISTQGGLISPDGWRSLLKTEKGLFYHHSQNRLMLMPRGASSPINVGEPVQLFLNDFPTITGATRVKNDFLAAFSCNNAAGTSGRILTFEFNEEQFFIDQVPLETGAGIDSIVEFDSKLAYTTGGVVYLRTDDFADNGTDFIPLMFETNPLYPFGVGGNGQIFQFQVAGEFKSESSYTVSISYDDGQSFVPMETVLVQGSSGDTFRHDFTPTVTSFLSLVIKIETSGSTPGESLIFTEIDLWVEDENGMALLPPGNYHTTA